MPMWNNGSQAVRIHQWFYCVLIIVHMVEIQVADCGSCSRRLHSKCAILSRQTSRKQWRKPFEHGCRFTRYPTRCKNSGKINLHGLEQVYVGFSQCFLPEGRSTDGDWSTVPMGASMLPELHQ